MVMLVLEIINLWLRTTQRDGKTCCHSLCYAFHLTARVLLYALYHRLIHTMTFSILVKGHWLEWETQIIDLPRRFGPKTQVLQPSVQ